jgi:osmoprotectant transport system ATP-binding protein
MAILAKISGYHPQEIKKRIRFLMRLVDLRPDYNKKYPHQLSGGEQQRVGICRAMMLNPPVFLLDEPFGALDLVTRDEIHRELLTLQKKEPRTIIMVTHDVNEAIKLADQMIVLHQGQIQQIGTSDEIISNPASETVSNLFERRQRQQ